MKSQVFLADGWRVSAAGVLGFGLPLAAGLSVFLYEQTEGLYSALWLIAAFIMLTSSIYWITGYVRRGIPAVEISDMKIDHGSIFLFTKRSSVPTDDVVEIHDSKPWLILTTRSGDITKIDTSLLSSARVVEIQTAIQQRIDGSLA